MGRIVFDCGNTFGIKNYDVDSGLALIYLLGSRKAEFLGVTSIYGNSNLDVIQTVNLRILEELGRRDVPIKRGGEERGCHQNEAVGFLAEVADRHPGELSIPAAGSLTSLKGAYERDRYLPEKVKEIISTGGVTNPLIFDKRAMNELNFSCDPPAARTVLTKGWNVPAMADNNYLKVLFAEQEYRERFSGKGNRATAYIMEKTDYWFGYNNENYGIPGFYNQGVTTTAYLMHPELLKDDVKCLRVSGQDLETGYLGIDGNGIRDGAVAGKEEERCTCDLPVIRGPETFKDNIRGTWLNVPGVKTSIYRQN